MDYLTELLLINFIKGGSNFWGHLQSRYGGPFDTI